MHFSDFTFLLIRKGKIKKNFNSVCDIRSGNCRSTKMKTVLTFVMHKFDQLPTTLEVISVKKELLVKVVFSEGRKPTLR